MSSDTKGHGKFERTGGQAERFVKKSWNSHNKIEVFNTKR